MKDNLALLICRPPLLFTPTGARSANSGFLSTRRDWISASLLRRQGKAFRFLFASTGSLVLLMALSGCAVHYYSKATGTEHLWGFGHLKMRSIPESGEQPRSTNSVAAFVTGTSILGLSLGAGEEFAGIAAGWDSRSRIVIKQRNSSFCLLWPTNSTPLPFGIRNVFSVRIGTNLPPELENPAHWQSMP